MHQAPPECLPASSQLDQAEFCYTLSGLWFWLIWVDSVFCEKGHLDEGVGLDFPQIKIVTWRDGKADSKQYPGTCYCAACCHRLCAHLCLHWPVCQYGLWESSRQEDIAAVSRSERSVAACSITGKRGYFLHKTKMCANLPPHTLPGHLGLVGAERMSWCCVTCSNAIQTGISTLSQLSVVFNTLATPALQGLGQLYWGKDHNIFLSAQCCPPSTESWWGRHLI